MIKVILFLLLWFSLPGVLAQANDLNGVIKNNRGVKKFGDKKTVEAFDQFTGALGELPYSAEVHYNLGNSFLINKEIPKAISEYKEAIRLSTSPQIRFLSNFNMAVALTAEDKIDEALMAYQMALEDNPDSVEIKTNIELLIQSQSDKGKDDKKSDKGDSKGDKKDQKDGEGKDEKKDQDKKPDQGKDSKDKKPQDQKPKSQPTPRPFDAKDISQQDVGKILDELKRQEEQIRARMQNEKSKDAPVGKDW